MLQNAALSLILLFVTSLHAQPVNEASSYREAYERAEKEYKVLAVLISSSRMEFPVSNAITSHVKNMSLVQVTPEQPTGDGRTLGEILELSEADAEAGVLVLYSFHEPLLDNHRQWTGTLKEFRTRSANEVEQFLNNSIFRLSDNERQIMEATNRYRASNGIGPLRVSRKLTRIAREFANDRNSCRANDVHDYARTLLRARGYQSAATENCAQGHRDGNEAVDGWIRSPVGHSKQLQGKISVNGRWIDGGFHYAGPGQEHGISDQGFTGSNSIIYFGATAE
jgi:hypothetical protein